MDSKKKFFIIEKLELKMIINYTRELRNIGKQYNLQSNYNNRQYN